jgi:hypothetical protein
MGAACAQPEDPKRDLDDAGCRMRQRRQADKSGFLRAGR